MAVLKYKDDNDNWQPLTYLKVKEFNDHTGAYKVSSVQEMNAITDMENGDVCVVEIGSRLPNGYTEVEYLESTGTQYIDTGYKPYKTRTELKFAYNNTTNPQLIGGVYDYSRDVFYYLPDMNFKLSGKIAIRDTGRTTLYSENANTNIHVVRYNENGKVYYDNIYVGNVNNLSGTTPQNLYLFANRGSSGADIKAYAKIYYCKIWDNGTLIRNYVPCIRISDNVVGMYDLINDVFYTNVGSGTFIAGETVYMYDIYKYNGTSWVEV